MLKSLSPVTELVKVLAPAHRPCSQFREACTEMRFMPEAGHVPRGFTGAFGKKSDVELILVLAEPGDPASQDEKYSPKLVKSPEFVGNLSQMAFRALADRRSPFHGNVRRILDCFWPNLSLDAQLQKTWITESVLCSAIVSTGTVSKCVERACGEMYLKRQIELFPNALVVALGGKAQRRLRQCGFKSFVSAHAPGKPGGSKLGARQSWIRAGEEFQRARSFSNPEKLIVLPIKQVANVPLSFRTESVLSMIAAKRYLQDWSLVSMISVQKSGTIHAQLGGQISLYVNERKTPSVHLTLHVRALGSNNDVWAPVQARQLGGRYLPRSEGHQACVIFQAFETKEFVDILKKLSLLIKA